jgi:hypothetical protein
MVEERADKCALVVDDDSIDDAYSVDSTAWLRPLGLPTRYAQNL